LHTSVVAGKDLTLQLYGAKPKKSYYLGCSQGGRQGIANAEKFPDDFDGIVAGAPAVDFNSLVAWRASFFPITGSPDSSDFIKPELWSGLIHEEILRQCDGLDGVKDGIIEYPDECHFRPEVLACKGVNTEHCLTLNQIDQVQRVFSPLMSRDNSLVFPGLQIGSETCAIDRLLAGKPFSDSLDWFRYVVHSDPNWNPAEFTTNDVHLAQELNPFDIRTFPIARDLTRFINKGGKVVTYHGMQDQQITSHNTARWYDYLRSESSEAEIGRWLRYFRISGMNHCSGGPGAWMIGQTTGSVSYEPHCNVLAALVNWVEEGEAPEEIEGTTFTEETARGDGEVPMVKFKRRHCRCVSPRT
jgi:feruloyl esterase